MQRRGGESNFSNTYDQPRGTRSGCYLTRPIDSIVPRAAGRATQRAFFFFEDPARRSLHIHGGTIFYDIFLLGCTRASVYAILMCRARSASSCLSVVSGRDVCNGEGTEKEKKWFRSRGAKRRDETNGGKGERERERERCTRPGARVKWKDRKRKRETADGDEDGESRERE